jgi:hypothetical protein
MAMETKVVMITPDMARKWLDKNMKRNRPVMSKTVHGYARTMKAGGWNLTHQGIAFDEHGELIDGQHRLHAIIEANVPVEMNVTYNVHHTPGEAFTIDMGRKRTYTNIAMMSGIDDPVYRLMGPYVAAYIRWKLPGSRKSDPAEILAYIERHYDDIKVVYYNLSPGGHGGKQQFKIPAIVGAALIAAQYRGEDADALYKFCQVYRLNDVSGCTAYNPKYMLNLREYVRAHKYSAELYDRCESSIWAFAHNLSKMNIRDNCYPLNAILDQ